ncbi:GMC family oxidoreductase [Histidinibacterium lentulum]|uniref:GMC family oxidoreductase n=1 Tax=Histidinibacterium lentulum TaxID=2480588 RepID=A0A3N2R8H6_9RHOB|nr:GMC family oxidoreductase [Histidinibacterium lentulum]ROU03764.1 GMC family oxidoreductase [Histidinibacterium lentulum]
MAPTDYPLTPDVLIVGAGVAGAMAAESLARRGRSVLMLEAGPRIARDAIVADWRRSADTHFMAPYPNPPHAPAPRPTEWGEHLIQTGPDPYNQQYVRAVGGTTWHWAAATWRFLPNDFRLNSLYGVGRDWPLSYDDLEAYYLEAETRMGVAGSNDEAAASPDTVLAPRSAPYPMDELPLSYMDRTIAEALNPHGFQMLTEPVARNNRIYDGRPPCCGANNCMPICPIGAMYNGIHGVEAAEAAGARVEPDAVVTFVELDAEGVAQAVLFRRPDGAEWRVAARQIVLAANGIETPRLMLLSAQETAPEGIGNATDQVGRYLMDHPGTSVVFDMPEPVWPGRGPQEMTSILRWRDGEFRSRYAAKKLHLWNASSVAGIVDEKVEEGLTGAELRETVRDLASRRCAINNFHEQLPLARNRLTLSDSQTDGLGLARPEIWWEVGDYVRDSARHSAEVYREIVDILGAELVSVDDGSDGFANNNHIMGGTIMGTDPETSVVDADCRVHGTENLWVASSSVFPSSACVNSTLTIAALSLRLADTVELRLRAAN